MNIVTNHLSCVSSSRNSWSRPRIVCKLSSLLASARRYARVLAINSEAPISCPLTSATTRLFDDAAFVAMKNGAILVNVTRGEIVDGDALVRALASGQLGGAALDVAPLEPLPADHPLWSFENVVMTPHTAGASQLRGPRNLARFCENLRRYRAGEELVGLVDKKTGY